jgi:hypothetical protein
MQVILQGSLRHFPPAELLSFLCHRGQRGTLDLETTGRRARVVFDRDTVVSAESNKTNDAREAVLDALSWPGGTFTLLDDAVLPEGAAKLALPLDALLDEAKRRASAASTYPDSTSFRVIDAPSLQQQVSLTAEEFKLLFRIASGKTFNELVTELGIPRQELAERLQRLEEIGLVAAIRAESTTSAGAEPTAPQAMLPRNRTLVGSLTPDDAPDNVWPLLDAEATMGRAPANAIVIQDGSVSSRHARIVRSADGFYLEDLQSRNGTFVNGEKVTQKRLLEDGDLIRLGKIIMTFNVAREGKAGDTTQPEVRVV